jgi:predicted secreted protein
VKSKRSGRDRASYLILVCRKDGILKKVPFVTQGDAAQCADCKVYSGRINTLKPGIRKLAMRGRKLKQESRSSEFRQRLIARKQTPAAFRPSLRALARELGTSHQLLSFYLKNLYKWQSKEYWRQAREVHARANAEGRPLTQWEEQQVYAYNRAGIRATVGPVLLDVIKRMRKESERGPLCRQDIEALKIFARQFPEAQELLQKCLRNGIKKRKRFAEIVKETPRQEGETDILWVRRIWDQCAKYDTKCPKVITEELLQKCSHGSVKNQKNNLPAILSGAAKSFGCDSA